MESNNPNITKTSTGKRKALLGAHLAKVLQFTMDEIRNDESKLNLFSTYCTHLSYSATENDSDSMSQIWTEHSMKHSIRSLSQSLLSNFKPSNRLEMSPTKTSTKSVKKTKAKRCRKASDTGKTTVRCAASDIKTV